MPSIRYDVLTQKHPEYAADRWEKLQALFTGGFAVLNRAKDFLPRMVGEVPVRYQERLSLAAYNNYFGPIAGMFAALLFGQELHVSPAKDSDGDGDADTDLPSAPPFYGDFAKDADLRGNKFAQVLKEVFLSTVVKGKGFLAFDSKALDDRERENIVSLADEEKAGADRIYAYPLVIDCVLDWEKDDDDRFSLVVIHKCYQRRNSVAKLRQLQYEEFKVWEMVDGVAKWKLFRTDPYDPKEPPKPTDEIPMVEEGSTSFRRIPIMEFSVPDELWIGNKLGPMNLEHFQRRNKLVAAMDKSLFELPVTKLGSDIYAGADMPSAARAEDEDRGSDPRGRLNSLGYMVIGAQDEFDFKGPSGVAYTITDAQLKDLIDEMYRVAHQMAQSVSATRQALARSGTSKQADNDAMSVVLNEYGRLVRDFSRRVYEAIGEARGDSLMWQPHGMDDYALADRETVVTEAAQMDLIPIPSETWKRAYKTEIAFQLTPNLDPETKEIIRKEIAEGVSGEETLRTAQLDTEQQVADNGPTPEQLGLPTPKAPAA